MRTITVGTRRSELALTQTDWVIKRLQELAPSFSYQREEIVTRGDRILNVTLSKIGGKGLFVKEIEEALLDGRIDLAVHSMKDMPALLPDGLVIGAVTEREDPRDCLIVRGDPRSLAELPSGAVIGTSSLRRQAQLMAHRPDLVIQPVRGNINTRIGKLQAGEYDGIILAAAGLKRLDWTDQIDEFLSLDVMLPAVGQGALAVQCRADDEEMLELLRILNHPATEQAIQAERAFLHRLDGGCQLPVGAYATVEGEEVRLRGLVASPDGKLLLQDERKGGHPEEVGRELAEELLKQGADRLLEQVRKELEQ